MSDAIIVALITGGISLFGSILTIVLTSRKQQEEMTVEMAKVRTEMSIMKEDIKSHNRYAQLFSENMPAIKQHMTDIDRRLEGLERKTA